MATLCSSKINVTYLEANILYVCLFTCDAWFLAIQRKWKVKGKRLLAANHLKAITPYSNTILPLYIRTLTLVCMYFRWYIIAMKWYNNKSISWMISLYESCDCWLGHNNVQKQNKFCLLPYLNSIEYGHEMPYFISNNTVTCELISVTSHFYFPLHD